ncbi:glucosamine 6-phosphate N-acetyltransferase [Citrus sinensis]|uniref:N-acetyltransferase domain-containing protein n=2 Tax=Citrus TaxID=2706 RepID=V4THM8_CITCL|nr:uncharacterized N-acetyltransferase ycf52 isoform X2 [Citrus x clementina]XP_006486113.1 uncharacterized N-acetyltransferase ycf52 isoform X1 [Citrus sinensis]XP_024041616.1 uncharacterized N-acetyltransferase ycf52 isoform X2 [Citrus x clementina]ESR49216.1 hypothetical protein CICLE_v10033598mg [Citrus x clementina]KAH9702998.1 glucosamine 6-phosphate N-acetyltransferase [Citrus sinensis]
MGFLAATAAASVYPSAYMELRWVRGRGKGKCELNFKPSMIPIYISTNPSDINPQELSRLFISCNHSCNRFPILDSRDRTIEEAVDIDKLCLALSHSFVVVSVFSSLALSDDESSKRLMVPLLGNLAQRVVPVTPSNGQLVGFGRAVSDVGLTASIHDIMVIPSLRQMGIGRMIVQRILRMLTSREIYDIAALCSEEERLFFEACGFGNDILGSTTMMYAKTASTGFGGSQMVKRAGRKLLLVPPLRGPLHL